MTKQENNFHYTRIKVDLIPSGLNYKRDKVELSNVISNEISQDEAHFLINTKHWEHPWHPNPTFPMIILKWKEAMMAFEELHNVYVTNPDYQSFVHGLKWLPPFSQNSMEGEKNYCRWEILTPTEFIFHVLLEIKPEKVVEDKQDTRCDSPHLSHPVTEFAKMIISKDNHGGLGKYLTSDQGAEIYMEAFTIFKDMDKAAQFLQECYSLIESTGGKIDGKASNQA